MIHLLHGIHAGLIGRTSNTFIRLKVNGLGANHMLNERTGDIWSYVFTHSIVIPTNRKGIMGAGLALQAKSRYPGIQIAYQDWLGTTDDKGAPWYSEQFPDLVLAPTKRCWRNSSNIPDLDEVLTKLSKLEGGPFVLPEMGCGLGGLKWEDTVHLYKVFVPVKTDWTIVHPYDRSKIKSS